MWALVVPFLKERWSWTAFLARTYLFSFFFRIFFSLCFPISCLSRFLANSFFLYFFNLSLSLYFFFLSPFFLRCAVLYTLLSLPLSLRSLILASISSSVLYYTKLYKCMLYTASILACPRNHDAHLQIVGKRVRIPPRQDFFRHLFVSFYLCLTLSLYSFSRHLIYQNGAPDKLAACSEKDEDEDGRGEVDENSACQFFMMMIIFLRQIATKGWHKQLRC